MRHCSITHQARTTRAFFMAAAVDVYGDSILPGYGLSTGL